MSSDPTALYSRKNPFPAALKTNLKLTGEGSEKDTRHFEIVLAGSGLNYEVGDSLGVFPTNNPALVKEILAAAKFTGEELVTNPNGESVPLRQALLKDYILTEV
ncbi:MAG TPA: sulfite reductase subunit alpha, partial [Chthoniobacterales bacterium]